MDHINIIFIIAILFLFVVTTGLLWLGIAQGKLKRNNLILLEKIEVLNNVVDGLSTAVVITDESLFAQTKQIAELLEQLNQYEKSNTGALPYHTVIQKIRAGVSAEEMIQESGLSRDEVALLFKLHGHNQS